MNPGYPSVGMFSWYDAHEMPAVSRRSTTVEMLHTIVRVQNDRTGWMAIYSLPWNVEEVIICHTPEVSTYSCNIFGLRRVRQGIVTLKEHSLACERLELGLQYVLVMQRLRQIGESINRGTGCLKVCIFHPDLTLGSADDLR